MDETTRIRIRYIFLTPRPSVALMRRRITSGCR
jgi:hypothetical protein